MKSCVRSLLHPRYPLLSKKRNCFWNDGHAGLSVSIAEPGDSVGELPLEGQIVQSVGVRHNKLSIASAIALKEEFEIMKTFSDPFHFTVLFGTQANVRSMSRFKELFDMPITNVWKPKQP